MIMKNDYFFLSNFYPCTFIIDIEGRMLTYQNSEAAFQAQKNYELADSIRNELLEKGIILKDTREGTTYEVIK